jgi:hypothetical protein
MTRAANDFFVLLAIGLPVQLLDVSLGNSWNPSPSGGVIIRHTGGKRYPG